MATVNQTSSKPTRKVSYAAVSTVVLFLVSLVTDVDPQIEQAVNVAVPILLAYRVKNADTDR